MRAHNNLCARARVHTRERVFVCAYVLVSGSASVSLWCLRARKCIIIGVFLEKECDRQAQFTALYFQKIWL